MLQSGRAILFSLVTLVSLRFCFLPNKSRKPLRKVKRLLTHLSCLKLVQVLLVRYFWASLAIPGALLDLELLHSCFDFLLIFLSLTPGSLLWNLCPVCPPAPLPGRSLEANRSTNAVLWQFQLIWAWAAAAHQLCAQLHGQLGLLWELCRWFSKVCRASHCLLPLLVKSSFPCIAEF